MKNIKYTIILAFSILMMNSCETTEMGLVNDPNSLSPDQANADYFLNSIQVDFAYFVHYMGLTAGEFTRIDQLSSRTYSQSYSPASFDYEYTLAYQGIGEDIRLMRPLADESGLSFHIGITQVFQAYMYVAMVDFFDDIPYSDALQAAEGVLNPSPTSGQAIYDAAIGLLDSAIANFGDADAPAPAVDFYYGGSKSKWIKAANSIKKKIYLNLGDTGSYNGVSDYIKTPADDFQFNWGTALVPANSRHPFYNNCYTSTGAGRYTSNWLMSVMLNAYGGVSDPRMKYYFYRQEQYAPGFGAPPEEQTLECSLYLPPTHYQVTNEPFCALENGYWGRDHGNDAGIPPDPFLRTLYGLYPAGGRFDDNSFEATVVGQGESGKGITPIMLSSWIHFMNAELDAANMKAHITSGIEDSMNKVNNFLGYDPPKQDLVDTYMSQFSDAFDAANTEGKYNIWATEYFISMYGNGLDAYNSYRRNGYPTTIQPNLEPDPGAFPTIMYYPETLTARNQNFTQRESLTGRVFWNTNGATNLK